MSSCLSLAPAMRFAGCVRGHTWAAAGPGVLALLLLLAIVASVPPTAAQSVCEIGEQQPCIEVAIPALPSVDRALCLVSSLLVCVTTSKPVCRALVVQVCSTLTSSR